MLYLSWWYLFQFPETNFFYNLFVQARNEKIEQLENDLSLSEKVLPDIFFGWYFSYCVLKLRPEINFVPYILQQVESFRELYLTEQEQKQDVESELKDCKVHTLSNWYFFPS